MAAPLSNLPVAQYNPYNRAYSAYRMVYDPRVKPYVPYRQSAEQHSSVAPEPKSVELSVSEFLATGQFVLGGQAAIAERVAAARRRIRRLEADERMKQQRVENTSESFLQRVTRWFSKLLHIRS